MSLLNCFFLCLTLSIVGGVVGGILSVVGKDRAKKKGLQKYNFTPTDTLGDFLVNTDTLEFMVSYHTDTSKVYHISQVYDLSIEEDDISCKYRDRTYRAIMGGAWFGVSGAIAGALSAEKVSTVKRLTLYIYTYDTECPLVIVPCLDSYNPVERDSFIYATAKLNLANIIEILEKMKSKYDSETIDSVNNPDNPEDKTSIYYSNSILSSDDESEDSFDYLLSDDEEDDDYWDDIFSDEVDNNSY